MCETDWNQGIISGEDIAGTAIFEISPALDKIADDVPRRGLREIQDEAEEELMDAGERYFTAWVLNK